MVPITNFCSFVVTVAVTMFFTASATAATNNLTVPGIADVWLAGQANGTILQGIFPGTDVAPSNSPVLASTGLNMTAGSYLTFSATGTTNYNGCLGTSPDGTGCGNLSTGSYFGLSTYSGPADALIGVFIGAGTPGGTAPAGLDFTTLASQAQATISPQLNQVFFIGDGLTGTGSGSVQQFVIPAGATRLYIGSSDTGGANNNNSGSFSVTVSDAGPNTVAVPAPAASTFILLLTGLLLVTAGGYWIKNHAPISQ